METLGEVRSYDDLHAVLRQRAADLELSRDGIDHVVGLQPGYAAKILGPKQIRKIGAGTMRDFLEGLGVKLIAVVDDEAVARHASMIARHRATTVYHPAPPVPAEKVEQIVTERIHAARVEAARRGAQARAENLSPEERSTQASEAASARWSRKTPRQRQWAMRRLTAAKRRKRKAK